MPGLRTCDFFADSMVQSDRVTCRFADLADDSECSKNQQITKSANQQIAFPPPIRHL
jgi:hypothetical protein